MWIVDVNGTSWKLTGDYRRQREYPVESLDGRFKGVVAAAHIVAIIEEGPNYSVQERETEGLPPYP